MTEKPTNVTANKATRVFTVAWDDGHVSVYPFGLLRAACPCAGCRGGHENMRSEPDALVFDQRLDNSPATRISNVKAVGFFLPGVTAYALRSARAERCGRSPARGVKCSRTSIPGACPSHSAPHRCRPAS